MSVTFREATEADLPAIVALLADDPLGQGREGADLAPYRDAFRAMQAEPHNLLLVGEEAGAVVATYQLTLISGLSRQATRRAQIEAVRVAASHRGRRLGEAMMQDAETRARAAGCRMIQLTSDKSRTDAQRFYERCGFTPSHLGYKRILD